MISRGISALLATQTASGAITNLVGASMTAQPGSLQIGQVYGFRMHWTYLHTAAASPTLTLELAVTGVAVCAAVATPVATANTFHGCSEGYFTVRSLGVAGSIMPSVHLDAMGLTLANGAGGAQQIDTATDAIDTTIARLIELRMRMTTAVASNVLTVSQGWVSRLVG